MSAPAVRPLLISELTTPDWHPLPNQELPVYGYLLLHDDGPLLIDTGVGSGNEFIEQQYQPRNADLEGLLAAEGVAIGDIVGVATSHMHFDHHGSNRLFPDTPIYVQRAEYEASTADRYTIPEWIGRGELDYRLVDGDVEIADAVQLIATSGHTPGHQSVLVRTDVGLEAIVAQAAEDIADFEARVGTDEALGRIDSEHPVRLWISHEAGPALRS